MAETHDGFVYGLHQFSFANEVLGLISDESVDWGGEDRATNKIWAAQKRNAPVKEITTTPETHELEFDLIELKPTELKKVLGGEIDASGKKWSAPAASIALEGPAEIVTADGVKITIPKAALVAKPKGKLGYDDVFKVHLKLTILAPENNGAPYIFDYGASEEAAG